MKRAVGELVTRKTKLLLGVSASALMATSPNKTRLLFGASAAVLMALTIASPAQAFNTCTKGDLATFANDFACSADGTSKVFGPTAIGIGVNTLTEGISAITLGTGATVNDTDGFGKVSGSTNSIAIGAGAKVGFNPGTGLFQIRPTLSPSGLAR